MSNLIEAKQTVFFHGCCSFQIRK